MGNNVKEKYGLLTAASMVVGIVIGSGIFFKADDILKETNGSIFLGVLGFLLIGFGVVCGAVVISQYAIHSEGEGGIVAYARAAVGPKFSFIVGWVMTSVYFPAFVVVLGWITALYSLNFLSALGGETGNAMTLFISDNFNTVLFAFTALILVSVFTSNILSPKLGGKVQVIATICKLIPLALLAVAGLVSVLILEPLSITEGYQATVATPEYNGSFLASLISIAFAFDGWIIATSISGEIKDSKKNLPKALILGTIGIVIIYVAYFVSVSLYLGADATVVAGNDAIAVAGNNLFFNGAGTIITLFVAISCYGGCNGLTLAYLRFPHAMVSNGVFKDTMGLNDVNEKNGLSKGSILLSVGFSAFFYIIWYLVCAEQGKIDALLEGGMLPENLTYFQSLANGFDLTAIPIITIYIVYVILFVGVFKYIKSGLTPKSYNFPIIAASIVALLVIYGSIANKGLLYILITVVFLLISIPFYNKQV